MADEILWIDHASDGTGSPLQIGPGTSYNLISHSYPAPEQQIQYASSADTEGEVDVSRRYSNRTITLELEILESGANDALLNALQQKYAKLQAEGGTYRRTRKDGTTIRVYDIITAAGFDPGFDLTYYLGDVVRVSITLPAKPLARGAEIDLGDNIETTLPALIFTEASIPGDAPALGRLVIDNNATADQQWLTWGLQSRYYDAAATAGLFFEAESRTAMNGSTVVTGPSGASGGASNNVVRNTGILERPQAILSTQASGGGAHLTHVGTFRVFTRVQASTDTSIAVALEWGEGDFRRFTRNREQVATYLQNGTWQLLDLGLVTLRKATSGTQRWEGRMIASGEGTLNVDWLMVVPVDEGSGECRETVRITAPSVFTARDDFQTGAALTGQTLPVGGTWTGAGDADDFTTSFGDAVRSSTNDSGTGTLLQLSRQVVASGPSVSNVVSQITAASTQESSNVAYGIILRYVDSSNGLLGWVQRGDPTLVLLSVKVGGFLTAIAETSIAPTPGEANQLTVQADDRGRACLWLQTPGTDRYGEPLLMGYSSVLATGGALATGKIGFTDWHGGAGAITRSYSDFAAWVPSSDAAIFPSQSLELRHDRIRREDSGGTLWVEPSAYIGDYLRVPPSGQEGRTARVIVKASRFAPGGGPDAGIDDISARLFITPRYLS